MDLPGVLQHSGRKTGREKTALRGWSEKSGAKEIKGTPGMSERASPGKGSVLRTFFFLGVLSQRN